MLLRFQVANFASLRDEQELSLIALDQHADLAVRRVPGTKLSALPVVAIYGQNASGKSNVLSALAFMREAVVSSHQRWRRGQPIPRNPFRFDAESLSSPSRLVVDLTLDNVRYEYGFSVDDQQVVEEWLYSYPERRRRVLFDREAGRPIRFGPTLSGERKLVERVTRSNSLYLSAAAANDHPQLSPLYDWFAHTIVATPDNDWTRLDHTLSALSGHRRQMLLDLIRYADLGVTDVSRADPEGVEVTNGDGRTVFGYVPDPYEEGRVTHVAGERRMELPLVMESSGTRTWLELSGAVVDTLQEGGLLVIDELDAMLHPNLASKLMGLFQLPETNARGAQLIFNTHDASLLGPVAPERLRRDQVWLTEKDEDGATHLFPLIQYRVRDGLENIEKRYLSGRYGAVPFFDPGGLVRLMEAG